MVIEHLRLDSDRRMAMAAVAVLLVPSLWYVRTDLALYGGDWAHLRSRLVVRSALVAISLAGLLALRAARTRERYTNVVFAVALALAAALVTLNALRPPGLALPLRSPLLHLAVFYAALPNRWWRQITPPLLLSLGIIALLLTRASRGGVDVGGDVVIVVVLNLIGLLVVRQRLALETGLDLAWQAEREARLLSERTLADLTTLRGIIPICAHCKKVRTEVGDWHQIERYVRDHSAAEFSHGICPECLAVHYTE